MEYPTEMNNLQLPNYTDSHKHADLKKPRTKTYMHNNSISVQ